MKQIITSLLDNDLYKVSMLYVIWKNGHNKEAIYEFKDRGERDFTDEMVNEIVYQVGLWRTLKFTEDDIAFIKQTLNCEEEFCDFLRNYNLASFPAPVISLSKDGKLECTLVANWQEGILFEVPFLSIVNEVYFSFNKPKGYTKIGLERLAEKVETYNDMFLEDPYGIVEMGTRRRFSRNWQEKVVVFLKNYNNGWFQGTSNMFLARKYDIPVVGSMAHEYLQAFQSICHDNFENHLEVALQEWQQVFGNKFSTALTDSITSKVFVDTALRNDDFAKSWKGFRHDSGDPIDWIRTILRRFKKMKHSPGLLFSNGLNPDEVFRIWELLQQYPSKTFGIGTDFTNDVGAKPLNIVMKMIRYNVRPVVKISDDAGKHQGNPNAIKFIKDHFQIQ